MSTLVQTHDAFTIPYSPTGLQVLGSEGSIEAVGAMVRRANVAEA